MIKAYYIVTICGIILWIKITQAGTRMNSTSLLSGKTLGYSYGKHTAIHNLDISINAGDIVGLLGINGAGKSTTLQILAGLLTPETGGLTVNDTSMQEFPMQARSYIGYLPEAPPLYKDMTTSEYLCYCARLRGLRGTKLKNAVEQAVEDCQLQTMLKRLTGRLSKGFQQRVGIAQAILHRPPLIILDEPTVGLDPLQLEQIRELLSRLASSGQHGIILSTHILQEVTAICYRVMLIKDAECTLDSKLSELKQQGNTLEQLFNA